MFNESDNFLVKAKSIFLIVVGREAVLEQLVTELNKSGTDTYVLTKISQPSSVKSNELMKKYNNVDDDNLLNSTTQKPVLIDDGVESAHGHTYAVGSYDCNNYILQQVIDNGKEYMLSFLKFPLDLSLEDDCNIDSIFESTIEDWFKKKIGRIPHGIRKNKQMISVVGVNSNILAISTELKK